jgi:alpha-ketoglutarate-dependent taurine dioxygenase
MTELTTRPISPSLGAEVEGFDPRATIDDATWRALSDVFDDRGLLVFRDLELDHVMQHVIVERLYASGEPGMTAGAADDATMDRYSYVSNTEPDGGSPYGRLLFHTDMMWSDIALQVASLYAVEAEQPSTPTVFTSTTYAWDTLPDDLKARVEALHARHQSGQQGRGSSAYEDELIQPDWDRLRDTVTPIANVHERTGRTMLYVCEQQTREIVELAKAESDALLDELFAHLYDPARLVSHQWRKGDLVIWDNQAVQHGRPYLVGDGPARTLRKIHAPGDLLERIGAQPTYAPKG